MKHIFYRILFGMSGMAALNGCGKPDYENKEFYKQEAYIISDASTAAAEREISNLPAHTFVDTLKYLNAQYDSDTIIDDKTFVMQVMFKVGIGGSLPAAQDTKILVDFNQEALDEYNTLKNTAKAIPDPGNYTTNFPYDAKAKGFLVEIKKGTSSTALIFSVPIERAKLDIYEDFAFPLKIVSADKVPLSRQYTRFMIAGLLVTKDKTVNWSGFPIPKIPAGRYYSVQLAGNAAENAPDGRIRKYKFITPMSNTDDSQLNDKYIIWGTSAWSFEVFGLHSAGWMYNVLSLMDKDFGIYRVEPVLPGNSNFPMYTFAYSTIQQATENNFYDPRLKTLTIHYKNVIGQDYTDILTYENNDFTLDIPRGQWAAPQSWEQVRSLGFKYWLPIQ